MGPLSQEGEPATLSPPGQGRTLSKLMSERVRISVHGERPPLALEFHPGGNAVYLRISAETVGRTVEVEEGVLADYDERGVLVGFELIGLESPHIVDALGRLKRRYASKAPELHSVEAVAV